MFLAKTRRMTLKRLPPELIDIIIDHLHSDRRALVSCSLVCKTWRLSARHHLFARLALNLEDAKNPEFLRSGLDIIPFARHIHLDYLLTLSGPGRRVPQLVGFNRITSLGLTIWRLIDLPGQIALLTQFPSVVRLELHHIEFIRFNELANFIRSFRCLETLVMNQVEWERDPALVAPFTLHFHAVHLDGGMDGREKAHMLLWLSLNSHALRSLYITSIGNYDIENLNALLQVGESSLEEFWCSIQLSVFPPIFPPYCVHVRSNLGFACSDRHPVIDLSHNSLLRFVLVRVYVSRTTWVAQMLSLITSEHMAKLSIVIRAGSSRFDRPDSSGWREMDAVLTQAQFATLERIEIICDWKDVDVAAWFSALLPQCRARDALKFVTELPEFPSV